MENMEQLIEEKKKPSYFKIIFWILGIVFLILIVLLYSRFVATSGLVVKEYKISDARLPDSFYGLKIAHLSDLHYGRTVDLKKLEEIVKKVNLLKPDIVVLTGDFFDKDTELKNNEINEIIKILEQIQANLGKYAITGNHDVKFSEWSVMVKNSHFVNLNDHYEFIYKDGYEPILIAGLSSNLDNSKTAKDRIQPIHEYISSFNPEDHSLPKYHILLLHEPDFIDSVYMDDYALVLAGHSHNGQVRLPGIGAIVKPIGAKKYFDESYLLNQTHLYISSGVGTSQYNFRLWNRPSINFYRVVTK